MDNGSPSGDGRENEGGHSENRNITPFLLSKLLVSTAVGGGAGSADVSHLVALVALGGLGFTRGVGDVFVSAAFDDVGEDRDGVVGGAVGEPLFFADEVSKGLVEAVVLHPLEEDVRYVLFSFCYLLKTAGVDLRVVPVDEKFGGWHLPSVLEGVDDPPVVVVLLNPVEHFLGSGVGGEGGSAPHGEGGVV